MKSVLVLGGGFAGLAAARRLVRDGGRSVTVRLIDRRGESVFSPLLPDLISARIRPENIAAPIPELCRRAGVQFTRAEVRQILPERAGALSDQGEFTADFLILALGCATNYFGNEEMERRSYGLKSVEEGLAIHERLCLAIDAAKGGGRRCAAVVVGGGYTGFETASHVAHLVQQRTNLPFNRIAEVCPVMVLEKGDTPLANVSAKVRSWAVELMRGYGVEILTGVTAGAPGEQGAVSLSSGRKVENALLIWAAGVTPGGELRSLNAERMHGRIIVDSGLRVKGYERIFAAGDVAAACPPGGKEALRMSVQFSLRGGDCAARNVLSAIRGRPPAEFDPWDPGYILPLAPRRAAGVIAGRELCGRLPSLAHYFMCAYRSWGWRERAGIIKDLLAGA